MSHPRRVRGNQASPQGHWDAAWGTLGVSEEVARAGFPGLGSKSQGLHGPTLKERVISLPPGAAAELGQDGACQKECSRSSNNRETGGRAPERAQDTARKLLPGSAGFRTMQNRERDAGGHTWTVTPVGWVFSACAS